MTNNAKKGCRIKGDDKALQPGIQIGIWVKDTTKDIKQNGFQKNIAPMGALSKADLSANSPVKISE